jgi:type IV secretion system protein VirB4
MYLDSLIGAQEMWSGVVPKIGRKFVQVVSIDGFPLESTPGILTALGEQPCEYRWSSRFIFMDHHEAVAHLDKFRKKWKQKIRGFFDQVFNTNSGVVDEDAVSMVADAASAIAEANSGLVAQGYYTSVVVLMDEDRDKLEASATMLEKAINRIGFAARVETINTLDAYLGSLPGHGVENVRRPLINTMNLADFLPTSTIWTGLNYAPCPMYPANSPPLMSCVTHGATPFRLNLHWLDLGHTLMLGPTRMGKSTKLALIALQALRYEGMSIYCFDKGMSMYPTTKGVGGNHFEVAADDSRLAFCPLQFLDTKGDRAWAMGWIDTCCALNGLITTPEQRNEIGSTIMNMKENDAKTMTDFVLTVQDDSIRSALEQYTVKGMMGHLLDAEEDGLSLSKFTTFEIEALMTLGDKYALPVLLYLFRRIEVSLVGQPAMILIDEAWLMLAHPAFKAKIKEWLKAFAKKNCLVLLSTQSLSDAANSGIMDIIIESTATRIYLPNRDAKAEEATALYKQTGLNTKQIDIIATAIPKRQYYVVSEAGRRLYEAALGPLALAFAGSTDKKSIAKIKELEAAYGDGWMHEWLAAKGLNLNDYGVTA